MSLAPGVLFLSKALESGLDENKIRRYLMYQEENERLEEDQRKEFGLS